MSDPNVNSCTDEDQYANDSFETEAPESSESGESRKPPTQPGMKFKPRHSDYWTCESSSDEDDVILGHTIAEINTEPNDFDDEDDDGGISKSLTPAARIFQMASASRQRHKDSGLPTPPNSKENISDNADDDDLTECDDYEDDDIDSFEATEVETVTGETDAEEIFQKYTKLTTEEQIMYEEKIMFGSCLDMEAEIYKDANIYDSGEVDLGEPNMVEKFDEDEEENDQREEKEFENVQEEESDGEENAFLSDEETAIGGSEYDDDYEDDEEDGENEIVSAIAASAGERKLHDAKEDWQGEAKSVRANDSMEEFKRRVMSSQRMGYSSSDGAGGDATSVKGRRNSCIPVWVGGNGNGIVNSNGNGNVSAKSESLRDDASDAASVRALAESRSRVGKSLSDFSDADTLIPDDLVNEEGEEDYDGEIDAEDLLDQYAESEFSLNDVDIDQGAAGDYNQFLREDTNLNESVSVSGASHAYSMEMEMFVQTSKTPKPPRKLKAGERRNLSFSNERLRDIERHNQILLRKILSQKPTYVLDEKKKKSKFASLPPTTRVSSAEINRKKQQRQIDLDNQMLKRKLESISKRKPKTKPK